jgi:topoisomerase IV subunit A
MLRELKTKPHRIVASLLTENENETVCLQTENGHIEVIQSSQLRLVDRYNNGEFLVDTEEVGEVKEMWIRINHLEE